MDLFEPQLRLFSVCRRQAYLEWNSGLDHGLEHVKGINKEYFYLGKDSLL